MRYRSHVMRGFDFGLLSNRLIFAMIGLATGIGVILTIIGDRSLWLGVQAGGTAFLAWGTARELDPDHEAAGLVAGSLGAIWALAGQDAALLPMGAFLVTARLIAETTGRRPLNTDLGPIALGAAAISFTSVGFVAGFGLAIAIYFDDRMATAHNPAALLLSIAGAAGAAVVASLTGAFPQALPSISPSFVILVIALSLVSLLRPPPEPTSQVDSRRKTFIIGDRVHAGRNAVGLLLVVSAIVAGVSAAAVVPIALALAVALGFSEWERATRARL